MTEQLKPLTEAETTELLDWVSACQSSYHIDSTPGHRFGGLGSLLQENRDALVEYVNALISARAQPAQAVPVLTDAEIDALYAKSDLEADPGSDYGCGFYSGARWAEQAVRAKMGVAVPMTESLHTFLDAAAGEGFVLNGVDAADLYIALFPERHHGIVGKEGA